MPHFVEFESLHQEGIIYIDVNKIIYMRKLDYVQDGLLFSRTEISMTNKQLFVIEEDLETVINKIHYGIENKQQGYVGTF